MKPFLERLAEEPLVCDGAMGTMLTSGRPVSGSTEELNLKEPEKIKIVHCAYIVAGAQIIETNTFGANEISLKRFGLEDKVEEINAAGVRIAKEAAAGKNVYVAGSVGPDNGKASVEVYTRQMSALINAGVDLLLVETMSYVDEALNAITAARSLSKDIPLIVQISCYEKFMTKSRVDIETFVRILNEQPVDAIGLNCFIGPKQTYAAFQQMRHWTAKPLTVQPNIGELSYSVQGITYAGKDHFGLYTKKFLDAGAKIIGGCCGTTPQQIKIIADVVAKHKPSVPKPVVSINKVHVASNLELMLKENKPFPIIEIDPPFVGKSPEYLFSAAKELYNAGVRVFTVADNPGALPRMDNLVFAALLKQHVPGAEFILHLSCRDLTLISAESKISGAEALGIRNILAITGDPPAAGDYDASTAVNNMQSIGLIRLLKQRNAGYDAVGEKLENPSNIYIGCAFDAGKLSSEKLRNKTKYAAGADFSLTQIISGVKTVEQLAAFVGEAKKDVWNGHNFFMIPGTYVFRSAANMRYLAKELRVKIVQESLSVMDACLTKKEQREYGYVLARGIILAAKKYFPAVYIIPPADKPESIIPLLKETQLVQ